MKFGKRTIFWLVPLCILGAFVYFYGPKDDITNNQYIDEMKQTSLSETNATTAEDVFAHYCDDGKWIFFKTQREQAVVEFKGKCTINNESQSINLQFLIDNEGGNYQLGALLVNNSQQTPEERTYFIEQLYENL
ncbi:glucosamine 6-phosphate synthetase [Metasolibacillus meyeri]|uniref:glucosamine 6-phosphate synthetase n=1 Tax=Metasolibacillus meyeri TaxID=1071052 RepID=UPI000D31BA7D|nr:glucosamine 6-phosphate synthetase [Metasolibacillus meyeri]